MVNPFEETLQAGQVGIDTLPNARDRHPDQLWDQTIHEQNRWEKAGGKGAYPVMKDTTYSSIMNYDPTNPYSSKAPLKQDQNPSFYSLGDFRYSGKNPALNPGEPWEVYNRDIDTSFSPGWLKAGIPATNQGYKVWNAGANPTTWPGMEWLGNKTTPFVQKNIVRPLSNLFGNEVVPEEFDSILNPDPHGGPPVDDEGDLLPGWELHQDGWHYFPPEFEDEKNPAYDPNNPKHFMMPEGFPKDFPVEDIFNAPRIEASGDTYGSEGDAMQMAQSQWKKPDNMEKTIQSLKLRPEFEGWTDEAIKTWIYNTARANRGGIIGLL